MIYTSIWFHKMFQLYIGVHTRRKTADAIGIDKGVISLISHERIAPPKKVLDFFGLEKIDDFHYRSKVEGIL
jgi:hypothetical protein